MSNVTPSHPGHPGARPALRILLLTHSFNSLAQRLWVDLRAAGHVVSVVLDIRDSVTAEAVQAFGPDVVLAPFLKRAIAEPLWSRHLCLVVHPGPPGDRGPSALDHAVLEGVHDWGVTVLQATASFDAGPVWAWQPCVLRAGATKASLYRHEVVQAATLAVQAALARVVPGQATPAPVPTAEPSGAGTPQPAPRGWRPLVTRAQRQLDWAVHDANTALRLIRSADGAPGAAGTLFGQACTLFDAHPASAAVTARGAAAAPGAVLARRGPALLVRCAQGALWLGHVRRGPAVDGVAPLKLAATRAFADEAAALPAWDVPLLRDDAVADPAADDVAWDAEWGDEWDELRYHEEGPPQARVGWLAFDFHNGAMSERQCRRLVQALQQLRQRPMQVLVLAGGADFFSNGIHLHDIEAAAQQAGDSAADASMRAIEAIDDVALEILTLTDRLTVAALRGNAGAGGCFLALAADQVWAHGGVLLNPHYKNMGNLYGSEYWTYLLPQRVGPARAREIMQGRLPLGVAQAAALGLVDACLAPQAAGFDRAVLQRAQALAADGPACGAAVAAKQARRAADEATRPLAAYRADELAQMRRNFYGFDPSYHVARHHFVHRKPHAWTPRHLTVTR